MINIINEKELKNIEDVKYFATHSGLFHADDVASAWILTKVYSEINVVRTRNPEIIENAILSFDVGEGEFDHHQDRGDDSFRIVDDMEVPYASAGLLWRKFGKEIIEKKINNPDIIKNNPNLVDDVFKSFERGYIAPIDAQDNGAYIPKLPSNAISSIVYASIPNLRSELSEDDGFKNAVIMSNYVLDNDLEKTIINLEIQQEIHKQIDVAIVNGNNHIEFSQAGMPWQRVVNERNEELPWNKKINYVLFENSENTFMVQAVSAEKGIFTNIHNLPEELAGVRDSNVMIGNTEINDFVFCHKGRFIAGTKSYESSMLLLNYSNEIGLINQEKTIIAIKDAFELKNNFIILDENDNWKPVVDYMNKDMENKIEFVIYPDGDNFVIEGITETLRSKNLIVDFSEKILNNDRNLFVSSDNHQITVPDLNTVFDVLNDLEEEKLFSLIDKLKENNLEEIFEKEDLSK